VSDHLAPSLMSPEHAKSGNGSLLFFRLDDLDELLERARTIVTAVDEELHVNPNQKSREIALRDPMGIARW
jgi:hypothetical protein